MNIDLERPSAKIYPFPRKIAAPTGDQRPAIDTAAAPRPVILTRTEFGSGWYHEAAVEAERARRPTLVR